MKKIFPLILILLFATSACNALLTQTGPTIEPAIQAYPNQSQTQGQAGRPSTEADVPRVTAEDAKAAFDSGEAVIVDVRSAEAYAEAHVAGALSIPLGEFENNITNIPLDKDQWIITYCT